MVMSCSRYTIRAWITRVLFAAMLVTLASCASTSTMTSASPTPSSGGGGPRLSIDKPVADFGKAVYDQMVQPVWTLTNTGTAALQIRDFKLDVKEGC